MDTDCQLCGLLKGHTTACPNGGSGVDAEKKSEWDKGFKTGYEGTEKDMTEEHPSYHLGWKMGRERFEQDGNGRD